MIREDHKGFPALEQFLDRLDGAVSENGHYRAMCPVHDGQRPALTIAVDGKAPNRRLLVHCHAGCANDEILGVLDLSRSDFFERSRYTFEKPPGDIVATYDYVTPSGELLFQVVRMEPKDFRQRRPDGKGGWVWDVKDVSLVPYRLPQVIDAVRRKETVYIVEGEKDVNNAESKLGITATTSPAGAKKWSESYGTWFLGADVVLVPDNDAPGKEHAKDVAQKLVSVAKNIRILELPGLPSGGDLSDWITGGGTREQFQTLAKNATVSVSVSPKGVGNGNGRKLVRFRDIVRADRPKDIVSRLVPANHLTLFYGASGVAKSYTALHLGMSVAAGLPNWLGFEVQQAPVVYADFELDENEQGWRAHKLMPGLGLQEIPEDLFYRQMTGMNTSEAFAALLEDCDETNTRLLIIDSLTIALMGHVDSAQDFVGFVREQIDRLRDIGVATLALDHQGKLQAGERYQQKTAFGTSFKRHLARSFAQMEPRAGDEGFLQLTLRHEKQNFAACVKPFSVRVDFGPTVTLTKEELSESDFIQEETISANERVYRAFKTFEDESGTRDDVIEATGLAKGTVGKELTTLKKAEKLFDTGTVRDRQAILTTKRPFPFPTPLGETETETVRKTRLSKDEANLKPANLEFITEQARVEELARLAASPEPCALDLEGSLDAKTNRLGSGIRVLSIHLAGGTYLLDLGAVDPAPLLKTLEDLDLYVHGAEHDVAALHHRFGFTPKRPPKDTLNLSRLVYAGEETKHNLASCLERELGVTLIEETKKKFQRPAAWKGELTEEHARYAARDVLYLEDLYNALLKKVKERGLERVKKLEDASRPAFLDMQYRGVPVDAGRFQEAARSLEEELSALREQVLSGAPEPPDEAGWLLDGSGSVRGPKALLATLGYEASNVQLATLKNLAKETEDPVVKALALYREKSNAKKYFDWPERFFVDGRIHPVINPHGAEDTGRATTSDPNLQGLDKEGPWRKCIRPGGGRKIVAADLAQIELRILAYVSGDNGLFELLESGGDLHKKTAEEAVGRALDLSVPEDKDLRRLAKRVNFGRFYGAGPRTITRNLQDKGVDVDEKTVKKLLKGLDRAFPQVAAWQKEFGNREEFEVRSVLGRRRVVGCYEGRPKFTERLNAPIQTTGTDILKLALAKLSSTKEDHSDIEILLSVHDEILLEAPEGEKATEAKEWLEGALRSAVSEVLGPEYVGVPGAPSDCAEANVQDSWGGGEEH